MILNCDKQNLLDALTLAGRAVSARTVIPVLECVLLIAKEDGLTIIGNDKEIYIETAAIPAQVDEPGGIALNAKLFTDIVRKMSGDSIVIETDENFSAVCKSGRSRLKIMGQAPEEFPTIPENELGDANARYSISGGTLKGMIRQTIFSVAQDTVKPVLTGEKLAIKNNVLEIVAIDMFRISYCAAEIGENTTECEAVVPGKALNELSRILPDDGEVNFFFTENRAVFEADGFRLVSTLLAGDFIRYDQIYNEDFSTMVITDRVQLLNAFERAVTVAMENRMLPVVMEINDDDLTITSRSDRGDAFDGVSCETDGKDLTIHFNPKYFIEALRAIEEERVIMKFNNQHSPCTIRGMESEKGFRYLIVPLRSPS